MVTKDDLRQNIKVETFVHPSILWVPAEPWCTISKTNGKWKAKFGKSETRKKHWLFASLTGQKISSPKQKI